MSDYSQGKVYKIWNDIDDDVYVGSTTAELRRRMTHHRHSMKRPRYSNHKLYKLMNSYGAEHFFIELIELAKCESKEELLERERHHILNISSLNCQIPFRTKQEYNKQYYQEHTEYHKQYYEENCEHIKQQQNQYYQSNTEAILARKKQYYSEHREEILERRNRLRQEKKKQSANL
jgi:hypothetical protein